MAPVRVAIELAIGEKIGYVGANNDAGGTFWGGMPTRFREAESLRPITLEPGRAVWPDPKELPRI